jgi:hypothetical protein
MATGQGQSADQLTAPGRIKVRFRLKPRTLEALVFSFWQLRSTTSFGPKPQGRAKDEDDVVILRALKRSAK